MQLANTRETYGLVAQFFHWVTAILIIGLLAMGQIMHDLPQSTDAEIAFKVLAFSLHKTFGMVVFGVAILRIVWAVISVKPGLLNADNKLESTAAEVVHWILYASILLMPLSGYLHHAASTGFAPIFWPFGQDLPFVPKDPELASIFGQVHNILSKLLIASVVLHIGGALKHYVIDKDQTLQRMVPGAYKGGADVSAHKGGHSLSLGIASTVYAIALAIAFVPGLLSHDHDHAHDHAHEAAASVSTASAGWVVDPAQSALQISINQMGSAVGGEFETWSASIIFDPDALDQVLIDVTIAVGSLSVGQVTDQALSGDFLNVSAHPNALWQSTAVRHMGGTSYEADGTLTLHGVTASLPLSFDLQIKGDQATATGTATINRMDFGVGASGYANEGSVGFGVDVTFSIVAARSEP